MIEWVTKYTFELVASLFFIVPFGAVAIVCAVDEFKTRRRKKHPFKMTATEYERFNRERGEKR
jgi:hypothetical protein